MEASAHDRLRRARAAVLDVETAQAHEGTGFVAPAPILDAQGTRSVPAGALVGAITSWLGLTYLACYVVGPGLLYLGSGVGANYVGVSILSAPAFAATAIATAVVGALLQPRIDLRARRTAEPVLSAVLGSLAMWAMVHNTSQDLTPFWAMSSSFLPGFLLLNLVESSLVGVMLGTLTRSRTVAFGLGAAFQGMLMALVLTMLAAIT